MDKEFYKSKTVWGFGLLAIAMTGQSLGVLQQNDFMEILKIAAGFLGVFGIRDAL